MDSPFNLSALTERELGHVEYILTSPSYDRVFRPFLMSLHDAALRDLLNRTEERKKKYSDESLAERANACKALVVFFDAIIQESQMERIQMARSDSNIELYDHLRKNNAIGPNVSRTNTELSIEEQYD